MLKQALSFGQRGWQLHQTDFRAQYRRLAGRREKNERSWPSPIRCSTPLQPFDLEFSEQELAYPPRYCRNPAHVLGCLPASRFAAISR
jgi:hypothetical protein